MFIFINAIDCTAIDVVRVLNGVSTPRKRIVIIIKKVYTVGI